MNEKVANQASNEAKGKYEWSWWSPLMSVEYASRGMFGMGVILAFVNFIPLTFIASAFVLKKKSIKDLSSVDFVWNKNAKMIMALQILIWMTVIALKSK